MRVSVHPMGALLVWTLVNNSGTKKSSSMLKKHQRIAVSIFCRVSTVKRCRSETRRDACVARDVTGDRSADGPTDQYKKIFHKHTHTVESSVRKHRKQCAKQPLLRPRLCVESDAVCGKRGSPSPIDNVEMNLKTY